MNGQQESAEVPQKNNEDALVRQETTTVVFSGPFPPPQMLEAYERILPGAAERIFRMGEEQSQHRRELESQVIKSDIRNSRIGLIFGLLIGIVALAASVLIAYFGYPVSGGLVGVGAIAALVGVFVYGSQRRTQERKERRLAAEEEG